MSVKKMREIIAPVCLFFVALQTSAAVESDQKGTSKVIASEELFRDINPESSYSQVEQKIGAPVEDLGSGIYIYVFHLSGGKIGKIYMNSQDAGGIIDILIVNADLKVEEVYKRSK